jgi:hypothetical protein
MSDGLNVAGMLPDEFVSGGLADDFDGIIREARFAPWDYNGGIDTPVLAARLKIEKIGPDVDEDDKYVTQYWSAGSLEFFAPSMDGRTQAQETHPETGEQVPGAGIYALRVGKREHLTNNTNWAQFLRALIDAQFPRDKFAPGLTFLEGVKAHFNRLPPDKKGGVMKNQTAEQREKASKRDVLVVTRFDGFDTGKVAVASGPTKPASSSAATPSAPSMNGSNGNSSLDSKIADVVRRVVKVGAPAVKKTALSGTVLRELKGDKEVNAAVKRVTTTEFLESLAEFGILYSAEEGTVEAIAID